MKNFLFPLVAIFSLFLSTGIARGDAAAPDTYYFNNYDVALVQLDPPHVVAQPNGATVTFKQAYLVRLFGFFPDLDATNTAVFIGSAPMPAVKRFTGGIYFLLYEKKQLDELAGNPIRISFRGPSSPDSANQIFEPNRFDLTTLLPLEQALKRPSPRPRP